MHRVRIWPRNEVTNTLPGIIALYVINERPVSRSREVDIYVRNITYDALANLLCGATLRFAATNTI